jgi:hypothetical protein
LISTSAGKRPIADTVKIAALVLLAVTLFVYATEWVPFMWPVMAVVDTGAAISWHKRRRAMFLGHDSHL